MKRDLDHCDLISLARRANRLPDRGTSADRSTAARLPGERAGCRPFDDRSREDWLALRTAKSGELVHTNDLATVTVFP
jgi:hypothetical protein